MPRLGLFDVLPLLTDCGWSTLNVSNIIYGLYHGLNEKETVGSAQDVMQSSASTPCYLDFQWWTVTWNCALKETFSFWSCFGCNDLPQQQEWYWRHLRTYYNSFLVFSPWHEFSSPLFSSLILVTNTVYSQIVSASFGELHYPYVFSFCVKILTDKCLTYPQLNDFPLTSLKNIYGVCSSVPVFHHFQPNALESILYSQY